MRTKINNNSEQKKKKKKKSGGGPSNTSPSHRICCAIKYDEMRITYESAIISLLFFPVLCSANDKHINSQSEPNGMK